jgi:replicative DNA helicase
MMYADDDPDEGLYSDPAEISLVCTVARYPDALAGVLAALPGADFYRGERGIVWDACRALTADNHPCDPVTVSRWLVAHDQWESSAQLGNIQRVVQREMVSGGDITPGFASRYAEQVAEYARRRRVVQVGQRLAHLARARPGDASDVLAEMQTELDEAMTVTAGRDDDPLNWAQLVTEFENVHAPGGSRPGIPSPWWELDDILGGLFTGRMYVFGGRPGQGKALALDTPIPTPTGWTTMGEIRKGDTVLGADGKPATVTNAWDVRYHRPCYEVEFSDGSVIVADAEHQWLTETRASRKSASGLRRREATRGTSPFSRDQRSRVVTPTVVTTEQIAATLRVTADQRLNHSLPTCHPLALPDAELLIDPYVLGVWLGDGHSACARFTSADPEIPLAVEAAGQPVVKHEAELNYGLPGITVKLRAIGVLDNKHIPTVYLRASESQRRALLAGLLDTDGSVWPDGTVEFGTTSRALADGMYDLIVGLGYRTRMRTKPVKGRRPESSICYTLVFTAAEKVFRLTRKLERQRVPQGGRTSQRYIVDVRPVPSVPVRCVEVDNADHLYLAGRSMIPTHNSTAALVAAQYAAREHGKQALVISKEMPTVDVMGRFLAAGAEVELRSINSRTMDDFDRAKIRSYLKEVGTLPITVDASSRSLAGIKALARAHHHRHGLDILVVDYAQLVRTDAPSRSRQEEVAEVSIQLKQLALELDCVVLLPAQLNRGSEQRADKRPTMADLRDSGQIEQDADAVILLYRTSTANGEPTGDIDFIVDKNRHGPTATVSLRWRGGYGSIG